MRNIICFNGDEIVCKSIHEFFWDEDEFPPQVMAHSRSFKFVHGQTEYVLKVVPDTLKALDSLHAETAHCDLRTLILSESVDEYNFNLLAKARGYVQWLRDHEYCGRCGSETNFDYQERAATCSNCGALWYPRISPCIIVLVHKGDEILLAKNVRYRDINLYSVLAGYVDPGETLEQAVSREVFEETAISVKNISYQSSQNWPFPSQLMVGFRAEYVSGSIIPQDSEIADADWYTLNDLPKIPVKNTIAGKLIRNFAAERNIRIP